MLRTISTIAAIILLLAGALFYYLNHEALVKEVADRANKQAELVETNRIIHLEELSLADATRLRDLYKQQAETLKDEPARIDTACAALVEEMRIYQEQVDAAKATLAGYQEKIDALGKTVDEILADKVSLEAETAQLTAAVEQKKALHANLVSRSAVLTKTNADYVALETDQRAHLSPADLKTHIAGSYDAWGYVIVDAGANKGIIPGSKLAVLRSGEKIAEILVTAVEKTKCSADIIPSTLIAGERIQNGDTVVSVRNK